MWLQINAGFIAMTSQMLKPHFLTLEVQYIPLLSFLPKTEGPKELYG